MKINNLAVILGVVILCIVIIGSQYLDGNPRVTLTTEEDRQFPSGTSQTTGSVVSADGYAKAEAATDSGVTLSPLTPWQAISNDVLADVFVVGYSINDPNRAITDKVKVEIRLPIQPVFVPTVLQEVSGLTTIVNDVVYVVEDGVVTAVQFEVFSAGKVFLLEQYNYRRERPMITLPRTGTIKIADGQLPRGTVAMLFNPGLSIYDHERDVEKAYMPVLDEFEIVTSYSDGSPGDIGALIAYLTSETTISVPIQTTAVCESGVETPDVIVTMSYEADLYERSIADWLRVPVSDVEWNIVDGSRTTFTQSFLIRQPFECVAG
tara:strand:+ start:1168 stop:2130 length:963 start_codon:yes stop_codon:yes gene_type:complete